LSDTGSFYDVRYPRNRSLRAADRDREAVTEILGRQHVAGRLDIDEFEERVSACLAAKTYAELDALIVDFPPDERTASGRYRTAGRRPLGLRFFPLVPIAIAAIVLTHGHLLWLGIAFFFFVGRPIMFGHGWWGPRRYAIGAASRGTRGGTRL
jgi:DUF1707 SHOCT-like domain